MTDIRTTIPRSTTSVYYAPLGDVVLCYGDVGYWNGIVRIGRLDAEDMTLIERQPDGF